jgi:hypothetical protein
LDKGTKKILAIRVNFEQNDLKMKPILFIAAALCIAACKKEEKPQPANRQQFEGGKGGPYDVVIFSKINGQGVASRMFLKYGEDKAPADTAAYEERMNSMVEPGLGHHAHFNELKKGVYFLHIQSATAKADTVIKLTDSSAHDIEMYIELK